ncbi:uncharacterized protein BYT42DRAFT_165963 [Radiomyces spectabilis]|uniref:uncharacterized protein n=1 Tax=Radiomyces spectabilis TaxID=64574 RepID=UPI00222116A1|nr:uncharacterized protein BYT42DRAFT_165963 [Radiomyces spectabilis]KAI8364704.1 hypothetical protein BYT42DRAFT_165963 [Radiomyces spectabilis]
MDHHEKVDQFVAMTGASATQAQFFLESSNWDLEMAASQFYDSAESGSQGSPIASQESSSATVDRASPQPFTASSPTAAATRQSPSKKPSSKIRTLNDLSSSEGLHDGSDDDEHENLYAGGEKSGMVVQGPNKKGNSSSIIDEILKKAAAGGAPPEEESSSAAKKPTYFTGSGYKLGSEEEPSSVISAGIPSQFAEEEPEPVTRYLTFWRNGFSVDDGPLLRYDDPANKSMLAAINSGRAPLSLLNVRHGQPVDVRVARRQDEDYIPPPKAPPKPFEGAGHRLGSPAAYTPPPSAPGAYPHEEASSSSSSSQVLPEADPSQPTTSVQIRLGDGSRLIAKLNHTHTVGDLRRYIEASRPGQRAYILQTTFPVKELKDNNQTLKDAGLLNSVVVQRYQ